MHKENLKSNIHKLYRKDKYIDNILESAGAELDSVEAKKVEAGNEFSFDTMSLLGVDVWEKELDYLTSGPLENKRSQIKARWKTSGKCNLELLQDIADSWMNGAVNIKFVNAVIKVEFVGQGVPEGLESLKSSLEEAKPAHLPIEYIFIYRTHAQLEAYTHAQLEAFTHIELKEKESLGA